MWIEYIIYVLYIIFKVHLFHQKQGSSFVKKKEYEFQLCFNISLNTLLMSFEVTGANLLFRLSRNGFLIFFLHETVKAGLSNTFYSSRKKRN